jgi:hypothetical protein
MLSRLGEVGLRFILSFNWKGDGREHNDHGKKGMAKGLAGHKSASII